MKNQIFKISLISVISIIFLSRFTPSFAQDPTAPSSSSTPSSQKVTPTNAVLDKIQILKEKVATKVAELRENEKKAVLGTIQSVSAEIIDIKTAKGDKISISYSQDSPMYSLSAKKASITGDDLKKDKTIVAFGYFDSSQNSLDGRAIYLISPQPVFLYGKISDIDRQNYTVTLKDESGKENIIDIETYTRTQSVTDDKTLQKSGFSRLSPGDTIQVVGTPNAKEDNRYSAVRILVINSVSTTPQTKP